MPYPHTPKTTPTKLIFEKKIREAFPAFTWGNAEENNQGIVEIKGRKEIVNLRALHTIVVEIVVKQNSEGVSNAYVSLNENLIYGQSRIPTLDALSALLVFFSAFNPRE